MQETSGLFPLPPDRVAWRTAMNHVFTTSFVDHNDPVPIDALALRPQDVELEIRSYEEDIKLLERIIQHKRYRTAALRRRPIPCELLCRIFLECREKDRDAPTKVSHVCRLWRQVAFRHRALWARLELGAREVDLTRFSEWAKRAGSVPLDLIIRCSAAADRENLIPWLRENSAKIEALTIFHMAHKAQNRLIPALPPLGLTRMKSLQIIGLEELDLDPESIARVLRWSPALTSLSLSGVDGLQHSLGTLATQLTHLSFGALSDFDAQTPLRVNWFLDIIRACTSLLSLECHFLTKPEGEPKVVSLPLLSALSIGDGPQTCVVLKYLHAPQLQTLRLMCGKTFDEHEQLVEKRARSLRQEHEYVMLFAKSIRDLHKNCSPKIKTVVWDHTTVDLGVLRECTGYLQHMEYLDCRGLVKFEMFPLLRFLFPGANGPFPRLGRIMFTGCTMGPHGIPQIRDPSHYARELGSNPLVDKQMRSALKIGRISLCHG